MKKSALLLALALPVLLTALAACGEKATTTKSVPGETAATTTPAATQPKAKSADAWTGKIKETMNSGGYTYVLVDTGDAEIWAAGPETKVSVGQEVTVPKGMVMQNFPSKTLDRVFETIYFVNGIYPAGQMPGQQMGGTGAMPQDANHAGVAANNNTKAADAGVEGVAKAAGGLTVAEVISQGQSLDGQTVKVRGRVVKYTANVMGTNWIHIQDGTTGDLTVTSSATAAIGDLILAEGTLAANKDFGAGYKYDVIIEKATVTKE